MDSIVIYVALVVFGAALGSFAGATVWRLRARQLEIDKRNKDPYDHKEYNRLKKLRKSSLLEDRSQCLHCSYTLKWYDLIPVVSWLTLRGKCRNCRKPIGSFELLIELGMIAFFVLSFAFWPQPLTSGIDVAMFILWLVAGVILAIQFAYDAKWYLLPDVASVALAVVGLAMTVLSAIQSGDVWGTALSAFGALLVLSGFYLLIYFVSRKRWVGFGDVKLGIGLALVLVDWQLALVALFLANLIGTLLVIPALVSGKLKASSHIPLGPLLILGTVLAWFIGWPLLDWYLGFLGV